MLYEMSFLKVQFLAMAKLKLVWLCSFGLTKSFKYLIKGEHSVFLFYTNFRFSRTGTVEAMQADGC